MGNSRGSKYAVCPCHTDSAEYCYRFLLFLFYLLLRYYYNHHEMEEDSNNGLDGSGAQTKAHSHNPTSQPTPTHPLSIYKRNVPRPEDEPDLRRQLCPASSPLSLKEFRLLNEITNSPHVPILQSSCRDRRRPPSAGPRATVGPATSVF